MNQRHYKCQDCKQEWESLNKYYINCARVDPHKETVRTKYVKRIWFSKIHNKVTMKFGK